MYHGSDSNKGTDYKVIFGFFHFWFPDEKTKSEMTIRCATHALVSIEFSLNVVTEFSDKNNITFKK